MLPKRLLRFIIKNTLLNKGAEFDHFTSLLQNALTRSWTDNLRDALKFAINQTRQVGSGRFSSTDQADILNALESRIGGSAMKQVMEGPLIQFSNDLVATGVREVGEQSGVDTRFSINDQNIADILAEHQLFSIGKDSWEKTSRPINAILEKATQEGWSREKLVRELQSSLSGIVQATNGYWNSTANDLATKCRELGRVSAYEDAGINYVQVRARIDNRTTEICRKLNGKLIPVRHLQNQRNMFLAAAASQNQESAKAAWKMYQGAENIEGDVLPENTGLPPYHYNCRTITVAYFAPRRPSKSEPQVLRSPPAPNTALIATAVAAAASAIASLGLEAYSSGSVMRKVTQAAFKTAAKVNQTAARAPVTTGTLRSPVRSVLALPAPKITTPVAHKPMVPVPASTSTEARPSTTQVAAPITSKPSKPTSARPTISIPERAVPLTPRPAKLSPYPGKSNVDLVSDFLKGTKHLENHAGVRARKVASKEKAIKLLEEKGIPPNSKEIRSLKASIGHERRMIREKINDAQNEINPIMEHLYKQVHPHVDWDLKSFDPRLLPSVLHELDKFSQDYPRIFGGLKYVGSGNKNTEAGREVAEFFAKKENRDVLIYSKKGVIGISPKLYSNAEELQTAMTSLVRKRQVPRGGGTPQYLITRQLGQLIGENLPQEKLDKITQVFSRINEAEMKRMLSAYGAQDVNTFIADALAEYRNSKSPRPMATFVGRLITDLQKSLEFNLPLRKEFSDNEFVTRLPSLCIYCIHYHEESDDQTCTAFPKGIPKNFWLNQNEHTSGSIHFESAKEDLEAALALRHMLGFDDTDETTLS